LVVSFGDIVTDALLPRCEVVPVQLAGVGEGDAAGDGSLAPTLAEHPAISAGRTRAG
jgi:hypothetical protein